MVDTFSELISIFPKRILLSRVGAHDVPGGSEIRRAGRSTASFDAVLAVLEEARDAYVHAPERAFDEVEAAEGFRYVAHLLSEATELLLEGDPERPRS